MPVGIEQGTHVTDIQCCPALQDPPVHGSIPSLPWAGCTLQNTVRHITYHPLRSSNRGCTRSRQIHLSLAGRVVVQIAEHPSHPSNLGFARSLARCQHRTAMARRSRRTAWMPLSIGLVLTDQHAITTRCCIASRPSC